MTLSEFKALIRLQVPGAKTQVIPNGVLDTLVNRAVNDVNEFALAYKGNKTFDVTAEDEDIELNTEVDDYLAMNKSGLWWNSGSAASPSWIKLDPMTRESLDNEYPLWHDAGSGNPKRYFVEGNLLTISPKPDTTLTDGFHLYYIKTANPMTTGTQYPFTGTTSEITSLRVLDDCIIDYVRWKLARPLGKDAKGTISKRDYQENLVLKTNQLGRRLDLAGSPDIRMRGSHIGK